MKFFDSLDHSINCVKYDISTCKEKISQIQRNDRSYLSVIALNIRSAKKNFDSLLLILNYLKFNFTFIVLTETWCNDSSISLLNIPGYHKYGLCRNI